MDTSSSSKVTVEYHDPSGVFPLVSHDIATRLPLRNLNWQSSSRPLRQIKSLHVDLVPDNDTKDGLRPSVQFNGSDSTTSLDIVRSGTDLRRYTVKERRHQIPGLQTSPYLRVYVLRCDDKDTYKTVERPKLRDWIRDCASTTTKGKKKGDNHDAAEWLILHIVIPDTFAASEPRWREASAKDSDELKERPKQGAKWPGKSKRTVFDKLRSDFNESGKSGQDRVAQIRLTRDQVPAGLLPTPAAAEMLDETNEERDKALNDLMNKLKVLILGSFDLRVKQYESDIAEQESRRSMPGFNFCTFFIHKEGLAKALESIGLVEDALVIYDELSLGLETILRDMASGKAEGTATTFAPFTEDIQQRITGLMKAETNGIAEEKTLNEKQSATIDVSETVYREKIVRSNISVFDFCSYLFSRQRSLILRLANAKAVRAELGTFTKEGGEDLVLISEVCWRASSFIHNNARKLRQELLLRKKQDPESYLSNADLESLVCSWTYTTAGKILRETSSNALDQVSGHDRQESLTNGTIKPRRPELSILGSGAYPQRTTSLPPRKSRILALQEIAPLQSASENDLMISQPSSPGTDGTKSPGSIPGLAEFATYRAELVMMQRKMLEQVAKQRAWLAGWTLVRDQRSNKLENVDLSANADSAATEDESGDPTKHSPSSLLSPMLASALASEKTYHELYERLSNDAMRYYVASTQTKSAEAIMGDLAILKYQQNDFGYAVSYFQRVLPLYAADGWSLMEAEALNMHAKCLKELGRNEEYVKTMLSLLAKVCTKRRQRKIPRMRFEVVDDEAVEVEGLFLDLIEFSKTLDVEITNPAEYFFSNIQVDREIQLHEDTDGFKLRTRWQHLLQDQILLDLVSIRLVSVDDPTQEILVATRRPVIVKPGACELELDSATTAFGAFFIDTVVLGAGKLRFEHSFQAKSEAKEIALDLPDADHSVKASDAHRRPWLFLYPAPNAFNSDITLARRIQTDKTRSLEIKLESGWNDIDSIDLRLKSGSAGLRLYLADAAFSGIDNHSDKDTLAGELKIGHVAANSSALVQIPYTIEQSDQEILVRLEALLSTSKGSFQFLTSARLPTRLPLDVDVNDIFHPAAVFSNFTVRTTSSSPLFITKAEMESSAVYHANGPPVLPMPMTVFESQPAKLLYKISRKSIEDGSSISKKNAALSLSVHYHAVEEIFIEALRNKLANSMEQSPFASLSRLLVPLFGIRTKSSISKGDIEMAVFLNEAKAPSFDETGWQEIIDTLSIAIRPELSAWLKQWHSENGFVALDQTELRKDQSRCITISVEVPNVDVVHKVSLSLITETTRLNEDIRILALGQPVNAQLKLASTRNWSADAIFLSYQKQNGSTLAFIYELQADSDSWIVGGQRRGRFNAQEGVELTFDLVLIPLKLGIISLPQVHIQAAATQEGENKDATVSCETSYESAGQVVQVLRDSRIARVYIPESSARPPSRPSTATMAKEGG